MRQHGLDRRGVPDQQVGDALDVIEIDHRNARSRQRLVGRDGNDRRVIGVEQRFADCSTVHFELGMRFARSAPSAGSVCPRSSWTRAQRFAELTRTSLAPTMRWVWESLPGWSTSKAWWACLSVDTLSPRTTRRGMTLARSVVLPEPLQPARPMMRMRHYSSLKRVPSDTLRHTPRHETKAPGEVRRALEFRDALAATPPAAFFLAAVVR